MGCISIIVATNLGERTLLISSHLRSIIQMLLAIDVVVIDIDNRAKWIFFLWALV